VKLTIVFLSAKILHSHARVDENRCSDFNLPSLELETSHGLETSCRTTSAIEAVREESRGSFGLTMAFTVSTAEHQERIISLTEEKKKSLSKLLDFLLYGIY